MSKAEERALEKYSLMADDDKDGLEALKYIGIECNCASEYNEVQEAKQAYFIEGYHQAEEDLELTWKDISMLLNIMYDYNEEIRDNIKHEWKFPKDEDYCKEVLRRFNEERSK